MPRYAITITIEATRLPDPLPAPARDPGADPMHEMVGVLRESMQGAVSHAARRRESGLNMSKGVEIGAESFLSLAQILNQFDRLAEEIECSNPPQSKW